MVLGVSEKFYNRTKAGHYRVDVSRRVSVQLAPFSVNSSRVNK